MAIRAVAPGEPDTWQRYLYVARYLARQDVRNRFRRSALGSMWIVISQLVYSFGVGFVWAQIFDAEFREFVPFLSVSFAMWAFIAVSFTEGCNAFVNAFSYIKQIKVPLDVFVLRTVLAQAVYALTGFITAVLVNVVFDPSSISGVLYAVPGLVLILCFSFLTARVMAFLGVRFRDLPHAIANIFQFLFVLTPVIYPPEVLEARGLNNLVRYNPLASVLEVVRTPVVHQRFASVTAYLVSILSIVLLAFWGQWLARRWTARVPYWL